jgi:hypothetical protein
MEDIAMVKAQEKTAVKDAFSFYQANQDKIVTDHKDEYVVIKGRQILGYYKTEEDALDSMIGEELETFIVQKCLPAGTDIANYYNDAVAFA